jgi:hypothetical protein
VEPSRNEPPVHDSRKPTPLAQQTPVRTRAQPHERIHHLLAHLIARMLRALLRRGFPQEEAFSSLVSSRCDRPVACGHLGTSSRGTSRSVAALTRHASLSQVLSSSSAGKSPSVCARSSAGPFPRVSPFSPPHSFALSASPTRWFWSSASRSATASPCAATSSLPDVTADERREPSVIEEHVVTPHPHLRRYTVVGFALREWLFLLFNALACSPTLF